MYEWLCRYNVYGWTGKKCWCGCTHSRQRLGDFIPIFISMVLYLQTVGSKLWSADILILKILTPALNAYVFGQFQFAANIIYQLNSFLLGFGEGVDGMPLPRSISNGIMDRAVPSMDYRRYYEKYAPLVFIKMGKYIREILDSLPNQIYIQKDSQEQPDSSNAELPPEIVSAMVG